MQIPYVYPLAQAYISIFLCAVKTSKEGTTSTYSNMYY